MFEGEKYDRTDDLGNLQLNVTDAILALKKKWYTRETDRLRRLIRY
jgi:hypothetical protein